MALAARVEAALLPHPAIDAVRLVGSRARGDETPLSDWDFAVDTNDFDTVAAALPELVVSLDPLSHLWDPLGDLDHSCFMFFLRGPVKVDLIFDRPHTAEPPWDVRSDTLAAIDAHFWDWIWWIASKRSRWSDEQLATELATLSGHLLEPLGARKADSIAEAVEAYVSAREAQERSHGTASARTLEREIRGGLRRSGYAV